MIETLLLSVLIIAIAIAFLAVVAFLFAMLLTKPSEAEYVESITRTTAHYIVDRIHDNVFTSQPAISGTKSSSGAAISWS